MRTPALITLEGIDGTGKSSQLGPVADWLQRRAAAVVVVREPGGTAVGEALRELLLDTRRGGEMDPVTETLLLTAARAELVRKVIRPALSRGAVVLCDRFVDSTVAYQGFGLGVDVEWISQLHARAGGGLRPDLTLLFDLAAGTARERLAVEGLDRISGRGVAFMERVRAGYLEIAAAEPERVRVIDASRPPAGVWEQVARALQGFWGDAAAPGGGTT